MEKVAEEPKIALAAATPIGNATRLSDGDESNQSNARLAVAATVPGAVAIEGVRGTSSDGISPAATAEELNTIAAAVDESQATPPTLSTADETHSNNTNVRTNRDHRLVEAELVEPPVEAYHVTFDEENRTDIFPMEIDSRRKGGQLRNSRSWILLPVAVICIVVVVIVVWVVARSTKSSYEEMNQSIDGSRGPTITPTQAPTFPYPCYTSTAHILGVQLALSNNDTSNINTLPQIEAGREIYIICPGTVIDMGTYVDPSTNDLSLIGGDMPLMVLRPNVTIQCGLDGNRSNNCTLDGGYVQAVFQSFLSTEELDIYYIVDEPIDNMVIRGITFTGKIENAGPFPGVSVIFSHPALNAVFEDCHWIDMTAPVGLIGIFQNDFQEMLGIEILDHSIQVTFSDCDFESIIYDKALIHASRQQVTLERCTFRNIRVNFIPTESEACGYSNDGNSFTNGCAGLLYCGRNSTCNVRDVCFERVQYQSPGLVHASHDANLEIDKSFLIPINNEQDSTLSFPSSEGCEVAIIEPNQPDRCLDVLQASESLTCSAI